MYPRCLSFPFYYPRLPFKCIPVTQSDKGSMQPLKTNGCSSTSSVSSGINASQLVIRAIKSNLYKDESLGSGIAITEKTFVDFK